MRYYGFAVTDAGRALISGWSSGQLATSLAMVEIMVGTGVTPQDETLENLFAYTDLIAPLAPATSTIPSYDGDTIHMTIEYRNDLNGGLQDGQWLSEFGLFVQDPEDAGVKILFAYGTLGDHPQYVSAYGVGSHDIRRFPISITIGTGIEVTVQYDVAAFMTADDVKQYVDITILPIFTNNAQDLINQHNVDVDAHPDLRIAVDLLRGEMDRINDMYVNNISSNSYLISFGDITPLTVAGVYNKTMQRIEF